MQAPWQLRELPPIFMHAGEPLLDDLVSQDVFLSAKYNRAHLPRLTELGLTTLTKQEMVDRLVQDVKFTGAGLRRKPLEDVWHTSFRRFVTDMATDITQRSRIRQLDIIPLADGSWTNANSPIPVYFPIMVQKDSMCLYIPGNIGLRKLHPSSCREVDGRAFYSAQGVTNVRQQVVIPKILAAPRQSDTSTFVRVSDAVDHLEVLFWFGENPGDPLWASDQKYWRRTSKLYFPSKDPFHAQMLLGKRAWTEVSGFGILESSFLNSQVEGSVQSGYTWKQWLEKVAKVRYYPNLACYLLGSKGWTLDPVLKFVAQDDPVKFVTNLKSHWPEYSAECFPSVVDEIKNIQVACRHRPTTKFAEAILPKQSAISKARRYGVEAALPFLTLATGGIVDDDQSWDFLSKFGVCCTLDRRFYFQILHHLSLTRGPSENTLAKTIALYTKIGQISTAGEADLLKVSQVDHNRYED